MSFNNTLTMISTLLLQAFILSVVADNLIHDSGEFHRSLAITPRPTRRRPTKNPNGKTRAPTRRTSTTPRPTRSPISKPSALQPTSKSTPKPTDKFLCSEASSTPESLRIACGFFQISNLVDCQNRLSLTSQSVQGTIPLEIGLLSQSTSLIFSAGSGTIPTTISCLTKLEFLKIESSELIGTVPDALSRLTKLTFLEISGTAMNGIIPEIFSNMASMRNLLIINNKFSGSFPSSVSAMSNLMRIEVIQNDFTGIIPLLPERLSSLKFTGNLFTGIESMPSRLSCLSIVQINRLFEISAGSSPPTPSILVMTPKPSPIPTFQVTSPLLLPSYTQMPIPKPTADFSCSTTLQSLEGLKIACNFFQIFDLQECQTILAFSNTFAKGTIPNEIGLLTQTTSLALSFGKGQIPSSISCLSNLNFLTINFGFTGTLPDTLSSLSKLTYLEISQTTMQGVIPDIFSNMVVMRDILINFNHFGGSFPSVLGMTKLTSMDISFNTFTGTIPSLPDAVTSLKFIGNSFTGMAPQPPALSCLKFTQFGSSFIIDCLDCNFRIDC